MIPLDIEKRPESAHLATSDGVHGLVAQGRTIQETIEVARDAARKPIAARSGATVKTLPPLRESLDCPSIVAT